MFLNKARRGSFSSDGILLSSVLVVVVVAVVGELRGGWHTSVSCPVSICPARKKLNWFLQGNKAKRKSPPLFQIYQVQVAIQ